MLRLSVQEKANTNIYSTKGETEKIKFAILNVINEL